MTTNRFRLVGKEPQIVGLMLLSAFAAMGAILMTPALPEIAHFFNMSIGTTQLTVTSFLLGYAVGQLIYGPIANRLGRKPALCIGLVIATVGSLFSILSSPAESFHLLILGRFLEAIGSSAGLAVCYTVINDFYYATEARRVTAFLMFAFAIVPGVAIAIGGLLAEYLNWQACFYFLLLYGLMLIYPLYHLPETAINRDKHALHYRHIFKNYLQIFKNKNLVRYAILSGLSSANVYVFGAEGPFIGSHFLHLSAATYGLLGLMPFIGTLMGSLWLVRVTQWRADTVLIIAFLLEAMAALVMFFCFIFHDVSIMTLLLPMGLLCMGHPMLAGTAASLGMQEVKDKSNGSSVLNFVTLCMPVIMTFLLGLLHIAAAWLMPLMFIVALILMVVVYRKLIIVNR